METRFKGTIEEILVEMEYFIARYQAPKPTPATGKPEATKIEINGQKMALSSAPEPLKKAIEKKLAESNTSTLSTFVIPKFDWDKQAEKSYKTITFCEAEDGKVMIFYTNSRVFTTKEKMMELPYPIPYGYPSLDCFNGNKKVAIRTYREYLATQGNGSQQPQKDRLETLKKVAEINKGRWSKDGDGKIEMKPRTKELHDNIAMKINLGVGAEQK